MTPSAIGRDELKKIITSATDSRAKEWYEELRGDQFGIKQLSHLFAYDGGKLKRVDAEMTTITKMAAAVHGTGVTGLKGRDKAALEMDLLMIVQSGRERLPTCLMLQQRASGLSSGSSTAVSMDSEKLWGVVSAQHADADTPDSVRGNTKLLKSAFEGLNHPDGRQLPHIVLSKVRSAEDQKMGEEEKEEEGESQKEEAAKKIQKMSRGRAIRAARTVMKTLSAAGAVEVKNCKKLKIAPGVGDARIDGNTVTLDCAAADADAAIYFLTDKMAASEDSVGVFNRFYASVREHVSGTGRHKMSVSGALIAAEAQIEGADECVRLAGAGAGARRTREAAAGDQPAGSRKKQKRGTAAATAQAPKPKPPKQKPPPPSQQADQAPNSSGRVCRTFLTTGKCPFGDACYHKHVAKGSSADAPDVRD